MTPFSPFYSPMYYRNSFYRVPPKNYKSLPANTHSINSYSQKNPENDDSKNQESSSRLATDSQYFDLFGIRLYFDDILILCLLFFLYQEEVDDQLLFIALLLLLLS